MDMSYVSSDPVTLADPTKAVKSHVANLSLSVRARGTDPTSCHTHHDGTGTLAFLGSLASKS